MFNLNKKQSSKRGFTLVEMMVAVSIFVIVAFIVVSALLTLSFSYKKAQKMRLLMDNLNFSLQNMSLNIREGINYNKYYSSCSDLDNCNHISFESIDSWLSESSATISCFSQSDRGNGTFGIKKCNDRCPCGEGDSDLVSPYINITRLNFQVTDTGMREAVKIIIAGTAGTNLREETNFFIQNTVAQRNNDQ